jgi:hypothetical protein
MFEHFIKYYNEFWEELIACFYLIGQGPHRKRLVQQFLYCCMCICCSGNILIEPLLINDGVRHRNTDS